jgi:hypothetical protein
VFLKSEILNLEFEIAPSRAGASTTNPTKTKPPTLDESATRLKSLVGAFH